MTDRSERAVAIVGLGAILPDAPSARAFRDNVWAKKYSITEVPKDRWSVADYYDPDPSVPAKTYSKIGSWVRGFEFDWKRWHIPPRVAGAMDEGQQWAITIAAEALADYGYPGKPLDTERTAVVLGNAMAGERHYLTTLRISFPEYRRLLLEAKEFLDLPADVRNAILSRWNEVVTKQMPEITEDTMPGELSNILSGRVANVLNLRGPNFTADAACASTFAALDSAVDMLVARTAAVTAEARTVLNLNMLELLVERRLLGICPANRTGVLREPYRRHANHALLTHATHQPFALTSLPPMAPHAPNASPGLPW
jgi:acyl transferase domain-containing protein